MNSLFTDWQLMQFKHLLCLKVDRSKVKVTRFRGTQAQYSPKMIHGAPTSNKVSASRNATFSNFTKIRYVLVKA